MGAGVVQLAPRETQHGEGVALVDELPLRRASTLNLLRLHVRGAAVPFRSIRELVMRASPVPTKLSCILINVGGRPLAEAAPAEELRQVREAISAVPIIVLSDNEDYDEIATAFRCGVRGFIPASLEPGVAMEALKLVQAGGTYFPVVALMGPRRKLLGEAACRGGQAQENGHLCSPRELAVLRLLVQAKTNKEIAREPTMEESTVKVHVWHIMKKLDVANRTEAALRAHALGILARNNSLDPREMQSGIGHAPGRARSGRENPAAANPGSASAVLPLGIPT